MQYPVSVGEKGLTIVSGGKSNDIALFFHDSLDYMAWCTYMAAQKKILIMQTVTSWGTSRHLQS